MVWESEEVIRSRLNEAGSKLVGRGEVRAGG